MPVSARFRRRFLSVSVPAILAIAGNSGATVALPTKLFGDGMVLQRGMSAPVWGTAAAGEDVTVSFRGKDATVKAGSDGKWSARIETGAAGGPFELSVKGTNTLAFKDVLVGEVWLAGGQSNMEFTMEKIGGANLDSARKADYPDIRLFTVRGDAKWHPCDSASARNFSATGYYYAKNLYAALKVPIGMISSNVGGTEVERWMDPAAVAKAMPGDTDKMNSDLYKQFIQPLIPYGLKGAIWYQGESDAHPPGRNPHPSWIAANYRSHFAALIEGWRKLWGQGDFPFHYVQLANYMAAQTDPGETSAWAEVRDAQRLSLTIKNTGMAVIIDIGEAGDIHPKDKWDVGKRLALNARALTYGEKGLAYSGPMYRSKAVRGKTLRLWFTGAEGLKFVGGPKLTGFAIAGADNKWYFADATLDKDTVVLASASVAAPMKARYGWANNPACNLYNAAGLPASPFQTDGDQLPIPVAIHPVAKGWNAKVVSEVGLPGVDLLGRIRRTGSALRIATGASGTRPGK
jgi:sialate O-acetylesterase